MEQSYFTSWSFYIMISKLGMSQWNVFYLKSNLVNLLVFVPFTCHLQVNMVTPLQNNLSSMNWHQLRKSSHDSVPIHIFYTYNIQAAPQWIFFKRKTRLLFLPAELVCYRVFPFLGWKLWSIVQFTFHSCSKYLSSQEEIADLSIGKHIHVLL